MGWFQRIFPSFAKVASVGKKNGHAPGATAQNGHTPEVAGGNPVSAPLGEQAPDQAPQAAAPAAQEVADLVNAALSQADTAAVQRRAARELRERSESIFAQSLAIWAEAVRSGESAVAAYEAGIGADPADVAGIKANTADTRARSEASQAAYGSALRQESSLHDEYKDQFLQALEALNAAAAQVASELEESAAAASLADSALAAAKSDLRAAQAVWSDLSGLPNGRSAALAPEPRLETGATAGAAPQMPSSELEAPYVVKQVFPGGDQITPAHLDAFEVADEVADLTKVGTPDGELDDEIANARPATEFPGTPGASAAEALKRELEALHPMIATPEVPSRVAAFDAAPTGDDPVEIEPKKQGERKNDRHGSDQPTVEPAAEVNPWPVQEFALDKAASVPGDVRDQEPSDLVTATPQNTEGTGPDHVGPSFAVPAYTGRVYLMLDAALGQEIFESVWEAVEEASTSGVIVDNRLLSRQDGVQMTLELGEMQLDTAALQRRLPGVALEPVSDDRLHLFFPAPR